jgi:hypothetical protein
MNEYNVAEGIQRGLEEALAYVRGDKSKGRVMKVDASASMDESTIIVEEEDDDEE